MTNQELFDRVVKHLATQGRPAVGTNGKCHYRTESGLKCAIGCLIPDEKYRLDFEGNGVWFDERIMEAAGLEDENSLFAEKLQALHDRWRPGADGNVRLKAELRGLAVRFGVEEPPELDLIPSYQDATA